MTALRYPLEITDNSDYIQFTPREYRANNVTVRRQQNARAAAGPPTDANAQSVILYMPKSTPAVGNGNNWGREDFMGPLGTLDKLIGTGAVNTIREQDDLDVTKFIDNITKQFQELRGGGAGLGGPGLKQYGLQFIPQLVSGATGAQLMAMSRGQVFNPNVELLYKTPDMRKFSFGFNFVPKSPEEAVIVQQIILNFKTWSAPEAIEGGMLKVPHIWDIAYMSRGEENKFMNKFKAAACTSVTVQANPQTDSHVTFDNGMPIETVMGLNFQEVDIITRKDHIEAGGQGF